MFFRSVKQDEKGINSRKQRKEDMKNINRIALKRGREILNPSKGGARD